MKLQSLRLLPGSFVARIDINGKELPQRPCLLADYAASAEKQGHDVDGIICDTAEGQYRMVKGKDGKWGVERV